MRRRDWSGSSGRLQAILCLTVIAAFIALATTPGGYAASKTPSHRKSTSKSSAPAKSAKPAAPALKETVVSDETTAAHWMASLTLREKIAQLIVIPFNGHPFRPRSRDYAKFLKLVSKEHVGGLILVNMANGRVVAKANPVETAGFLNRMQRLSKVPLIVAGDFERGASMRIEGATVFPHAMAFTASGDPGEARVEAEITAKESRAMGFHWLLFPDADVNNNPDNPIINIRSFGEDPAAVSKFVSAFIDGAHSDPKNRVLVTAKHFPGHGDTATDTHMNLATITADLPRLQALEWAPFRAAISSNVDSIMTAHIAVPALDDAGVPATLSPRILSGILRDQLGFEGLIVTDALDMGGIAHGFSSGEAAVRALNAGADVLLMPADPLAAINAVVAAVKAREITEQRIDRSVNRILTAKARVGLAANKLVDVSRIGKIVNAPESNVAAQRIADRSVTLVRNQDAMVPLKAAASTVFYVLKEGPASMEGAAFTAEIRKRLPLARIIQADSFMPDVELNGALQRGEQADRYVIAAFASVAANRGTAALGGGLSKLVQGLTDTKKPVVFLSLGNPYLLRNFPDVAAYLATYSTVPPSEIAVVKALFGEIAIEGKLPVSIPGFATAGDGIMMPPQGVWLR